MHSIHTRTFYYIETNLRGIRIVFTLLRILCVKMYCFCFALLGFWVLLLLLFVVMLLPLLFFFCSSTNDNGCYCRPRCCFFFLCYVQLFLCTDCTHCTMFTKLKQQNNRKNGNLRICKRQISSHGQLHPYARSLSKYIVAACAWKLQNGRTNTHTYAHYAKNEPQNTSTHFALYVLFFHRCCRCRGRRRLDRILNAVAREFCWICCLFFFDLQAVSPQRQLKCGKSIEKHIHAQMRNEENFTRITGTLYISQ